MLHFSFDAFARSILNKLANIFKTARSVPATSSMGVCTFITHAPGPVTACVAFSSLYKIDKKKSVVVFLSRSADFRLEFSCLLESKLPRETTPFSRVCDSSRRLKFRLNGFISVNKATLRVPRVAHFTLMSLTYLTLLTT